MHGSSINESVGKIDCEVSTTSEGKLIMSHGNVNGRSTDGLCDAFAHFSTSIRVTSLFISRSCVYRVL